VVKQAWTEDGRVPDEARSVGGELESREGIPHLPLGLEQHADLAERVALTDAGKTQARQLAHLVPLLVV